MTQNSFTEESVRKLAQLARMELTVEEVQRFTSQIANVLKYIEKLNALNTSQVEPLVNPETTTSRPDALRSVERSDVVVTSPGVSKMLESAPEQIYDNFKVPQVIGG